MKSDIQINQEATLKPMKEVIKDFKIDEKNFIPYGEHKGKLEITNSKEKAKLILVTAINPTPAGEGKTTTSIAIADGMKENGQNALLALREPSLGPIFGAKGGATGGGFSQIAPIEDINLHFNGDFHAITVANNLIAAAIDNHIYWGNDLKLKNVTFSRCLDINDRTLRNAGTKEIKGVTVNVGFVITAASEMMAIFTLSTDLEDLRKRVDSIIIGFDTNDKPVFAKSLNVTGSVIAILKDAIKPNIVQTLEGNLALVHGGPFANIAHGCNSIIATKVALQNANWVITEAGFGSDLGAEKFLNIKSREANLKPSIVVVVATIRALKMQGGATLADLKNSDVKALEKGVAVLGKHIDIVKSFDLDYVVAINHFATDSKEEMDFLENWLNKNNHKWEYSNGWADGGKGGQKLARLIVEHAKPRDVKYTYDLKDSISTKVEKIAKTIYGAGGVEYSPQALETIKMLEANKLDDHYVCIAKTPSSLTDDSTKIGVHTDWNLKVDEVHISNGAKLIVVQCGKIFRMPGLAKKSNFENIDFDGTKITGLD